MDTDYKAKKIMRTRQFCTLQILARSRGGRNQVAGQVDEKTGHSWGAGRFVLLNPIVISIGWKYDKNYLGVASGSSVAASTPLIL
jgi:hypothetical protein